MESASAGSPENRNNIGLPASFAIFCFYLTSGASKTKRILCPPLVREKIAKDRKVIPVPETHVTVRIEISSKPKETAENIAPACEPEDGGRCRARW